MKKLLFMFLTLFLVGCSNKISQEDWAQVEIGMSVSEVDDLLGKPDSTTEDNSAISEKVYDTYKKLNEANSLIPNYTAEEKLKNLDKVYVASESGKTVKEYIYTVERENGEYMDSNIYFVGGSVTYVNSRIE